MFNNVSKVQCLGMLLYLVCILYVYSLTHRSLCTSYQGMETADYNTICNGISNGHGIVANVHNGGHWVLLTGCLGNNMYSVNDPGYSTTQYSHSEVLREAVYH